MTQFAVEFLRSVGRGDRAVKMLQDRLAEDPGDNFVRNMLAAQLKVDDRHDEAGALLVEATELFDTPQAWLNLAEHWAAQEEPQKALDALERVLEQVPGQTDPLRFAHADYLASAGELERAEQVALEIEGDSYRHVVLGRIYYDRGDPEKALGHLDQGLREWPNHPTARYLAGRAALALGQVERGRSELREALRIDAGATNAGIELAVMNLNTGRPAAAISTCGYILNDPKAKLLPMAVEAMAVVAKAHWALGDEEKAMILVDGIARDPKNADRAALLRASLVAERDGAAAAVAILEKSDIDFAAPENEVALRSLCELLAEAGRSDDALARAQTAVAAQPDAPGPRDVLARLLTRMGRGADAMAAFDDALRLDPAFAPALEGKAHLTRAAGDQPGAVALLARAAEAEPRSATYPYQAAQMELAAGRTAPAEALLREALRRDPLHAHASNDLAWLLADRGEDLDAALRMATFASRADRSASVLDTVGWVHYQRGEYVAAIAVLEEAHGLAPDSPSITYRLGLAVAASGDEARGAELIQEALDTGAAFPEAAAAREQLVKLGGAR